MTLQRPFALTFVAATFCFSALHSQAAFIVPSALLSAGSTNIVPSQTSALPGTVLAMLVSPYSYTNVNGTTSGAVVSAVFLNGGTLDFYYQTFNNASSASTLTRQFATSFSGYHTQVAYALMAEL